MRISLNKSGIDPSVPADSGAPDAKNHSRVARWVARFGVAGFLFFLIKGLAWLIVPAAIAAYAAKS
jgi:hypothetical protein